MNKEKLPKKIPIFPLSNAIFFPNTILPLNIFEKRYLQMVDDTMKGNRLFGMIQPMLKTQPKNEVYKVGCLGKIISFSETKDKRFVISLSGISRFRIKEELTTSKPYREFEVDYSDFSNDLINNLDDKAKLPPEKIINKVKKFFNKKNYIIKFNELDRLDLDQLVSTVSMIAPFSVEEKQKLMETVKIEDKINVLEEIIDFNLFENISTTTMQ